VAAGWRQPAGLCRNRGASKKTGEGLPYLTIMVFIIVLVLPGLAWLVLTGHEKRV